VAVKVVDATAPVVRYAIRKGGTNYLGTPAGETPDLNFKSQWIGDAVKFATAEDAQALVKQLFEIPDPTKFDPKSQKQVPDDEAPDHIGKFHGESTDDLEIVATHA
jgi:hypothetical protein